MDRHIFEDDDDDSDESEEHHQDKKIISINVPFQNAAVILMSHPATLYLYKYVSVTMLSGQTSINGYVMDKKATYDAYSSEKTGILEVKTESFETIWQKKSESSLFHSLSNIFSSREGCQKVLDQMGFSTVVLYISRCVLPRYIDFVKFYHPEAFAFTLFKNSPIKDNIWFADNKTPSLQFNEEADEAACKIAGLIRSAELIDGIQFPKILIYGPRNSGKSTLLKYLINRLLPQCGMVYYLDTDPGQPEFTPPGVVSLTEVSEPILGPPFFHQKTNAKMTFTGDVSPSFIDMYRQGVKSLMKMYSDSKPGVLFVNTMGWLEGTGLQCLKDTIFTVQPTVFIEIVIKNEAAMFDYRSCLLHDDSQYIQILYKQEHEGKTLPPKEMRELSILSHFGRCHLPYMPLMTINEFKPFCVPWNKIAVSIFPERNIPVDKLAEALNGSIVALCSVSESSILEYDRQDFPLTLESEPENEFLAYGLVLAIDLKNELLNIITPLKLDELARVNAIIKGNIMVPDALILKQEIYNVEIPYTNVYKETAVEEDPMDVSMVSLKYFAKTGTETPESKPSGFKVFSPESNFRKPAAKRYSHNFSRRSKK